MITFEKTPDPFWLVIGAIAVTGLLWWSVATARGSAGRGRKTLLIVLRLAVVALIVFVLLDPQRMTENKTFRPGRAVALLDASRSMAVNDGESTRLAVATDWMSRKWKLPDGFSGGVFSFHDELNEVDGPQGVTTGGEGTGILDALSDLADATAAEPPSSILLISDGADTRSARGRDVGARLARMQVPVSVLTIGDTNEPPDVVVEGVRPKLVTDRRTMIEASVSLNSPGFDGVDGVLRVLDGDLELASKPVTLNGGDQTIEFKFPPHRNGYQVFTVAADPVEGERLEENNRRDFGLTVVDPTLRVLYMEATAINNEMPEIFFLKHALEDEPGIDVHALFYDQHGAASIAQREQVAYVDPKNGDRVYRVQHSRHGLPDTLDGLLRYHVIICSDVARTAFNRAQMENIVRFVEEFGGGFVMVGGDTSFGSGYFDQTPIEKVIPVAMSGSRNNVHSSFQIRPAREALGHPILQVAEGGEANRSAWDKMPPFFGYNLVDHAKAGATVLWSHPTARNQFGPHVILAVQSIGKGRSMAFTTDTTAAWGEAFERQWGEPSDSGLGNDTRYYKQFWVNAVRWLAAHRFEREHMPVKLELETSETRPEEGIAFSATVELLDGKSAEDLTAEARLWEGERLSQEIDLLWDGSADAWRGIATPDAKGRFALKFSLVDPDGRSTTVTHLIHANERDVEMAAIRARPELLEELATATGGRVLRLDSSDDAVRAALSGLRVASVKFEKEPLWDTWVWLLCLVGLLTVEWTVRRSGGLA